LWSGILAQAAEWQSTLAERLAQQNQREQRGAEATEHSRAAAAVGSWRLVDDRLKPEGVGGLQSPGEAVRQGGPEAPCDACQPFIAPHRSWETAPRDDGPSHVASVQAAETASILHFLSDAEWRVARQASRGLGGRLGPVQAPGSQGSSVPGQGGALSECTFMEGAKKSVKNTVAARLYEYDQRFDFDEVDVLGEELVRWKGSCGTFLGEQIPDGVVVTLGAWLEEFLLQAECLVQVAAELSTSFSQEEGCEAWATLESEVAALRRASGGSDWPAGSEAAGSFAVLATLLEEWLLRARGWASALLAWRAAVPAGLSRR
jgi:hypothetical protein